MRKNWNIMDRAAMCSFAAAVIAAVGAGSGMTAHAEMILDSEIVEIQAVQEIVPESENMSVLQAEAPAVAEMMPEAGEPEINLTDIVVIEDDLVPGAALPDPGVALSEGEAQAPEVSEDVSVSVDDTPEEAVPAERPETDISGMLMYEDSEVAVKVFVSETSQLPANTEVKVTRLEEGSEQYEAAKEAACQSLAADENASYAFYDVTLESEGQALDVEEGTVSVQMEFKTFGNEKKDVVEIEETENGKVARNVTNTAAASEKAESIALAY